MSDKTLPADFRIYVNVTRNRKTRRLMREMGDRAFYCIVSLWCYVAENCPDGNLGDMDADDLADASNWTGSTNEEWLDYLIQNGWLDERDGAIFIHDWAEMQPWAARDRSKQSEANRQNALKRWGKIPNNANSHAIAMQSQCEDKMQLQCPHTHTHTHTHNPEEIEESPGELNSPAPPPKQNALRHVSLNETTWEFEGVTDEDRANWSKAAPAIDHDRELAKAINWLQSHPGKLAARRKGGRWVVFLNSWMTKAQEYAESKVAVARPAGNMNSGSPAPTPRPQPAPIGQQAQVRQRPKVRGQVTDWEQVKAVLKPEISERAFAKFIQAAKYLGETDEPPCLVLHCADKYSADYIFHNLRQQLVGAVKAVTGQDLGVVVDWDEEQVA